jgi:ankyrin repeat protein
MSVVAVAVIVSVCLLLCREWRCLCLVSRSDQNGRTALLVACASGHLDVARWLVDAGSDVRSERDNVSCPLLCSCTSAAGLHRRLSSCECVRLVGCGCIPSPGAEELRALLLSQDGQTALSLACRKRHWSVARWLIDDQDVDLVRRCAVAYGHCCQHDRRGRVA